MKIWNWGVDSTVVLCRKHQRIADINPECRNHTGDGCLCKALCAHRSNGVLGLTATGLRNFCNKFQARQQRGSMIDWLPCCPWVHWTFACLQALKKARGAWLLLGDWGADPSHAKAADLPWEIPFCPAWNSREGNSRGCNSIFLSGICCL